MLEEAIKRLGNLAIHHRDDTFPENEKAIKLGIEGLKWIKEERELQGMLYPGLLPGETHIPENIGKLPSDNDAE